MREHEITLIKAIESLNAMKIANTWMGINAQEDLIIQAFEVLRNEPLGTVSPEFLKDPLVSGFMQSGANRFLKLWYFMHTNDLETIEKKIKELIFIYREELDRGFGIPPDEIYSPILIRSVYLSGNTELINIFIRHLPIPKAALFKGDKIPSMVTENQTRIEQSIKQIQEGSPTLSLDEITEKIIKIQRWIRSKSRHQEELKRLPARADWLCLGINETRSGKLIQEANTPYQPKCEDKALARRIMRLAQQVRLYSTVKHWTSGDHIGSIFNDALYGRRNLLQSYINFRPATLNYSDIKEGDGNVICLGPCQIDPKARKMNTVEIVFDMDKIASNNPSIFFKQRDFNFNSNKRRSVPTSVVDKKYLIFSHTNRPLYDSEKQGFCYLNIYNYKQDGLDGVFVLPNYSLISYNVQNIHQI